MTTLQILLSAALAALLVAAIVTDVRARIIPNGLNAAVALLAIAWWWADGATPAEILLRIGLACLVFALFAAAFALGMMGGGDVKLIGALALWLPGLKLLKMLVWMSVAGGVLTLAMLAVHRCLHRQGQPEIPYGVAIAGAALLIMANDILTIRAA